MRKLLFCIVVVCLVFFPGCGQEGETVEGLTVSPEYVTRYQADRTLTVEVEAEGEFRESIGPDDIALSQGLAGLTVSAVTRLSAKTIRVVLSGEASGLLADPDYGYVTVLSRALYSDNAVSKNVTGKVRIGTPRIVQTSYVTSRSARNSRISVSYTVEGGEWKASLNLKEDIQIGGVLSKAESVELAVEKDTVILSFYEIPEGGEGSILFKSSASSLNMDVEVKLDV